MRRILGRARGVTLLEILVVVAVVGLIFVILLPNLIDGLHKSKQKRTVADMHAIATGMMSYHLDMSGAAAAGYRVDIGDYDTIDHENLAGYLLPVYLKNLPKEDAWGHPFDYYYGKTTLEFGWQLDFGVRSRGRDGVAEGDAYTWGAFPPTDYDRDIVWLNGVFVTWPGWIEGDVVTDPNGSGCNQGVGNGSEGCDPGDSNHNQTSNDEPNSPAPTPGNPGRKGGKKGGG
jgi:general secretion pathway protein G